MVFELGCSAHWYFSARSGEELLDVLFHFFVSAFTFHADSNVRSTVGPTTDRFTVWFYDICSKTLDPVASFKKPKLQIRQNRAQGFCCDGMMFNDLI